MYSLLTQPTFFSPSELREDSCPPPNYLVEGVKALIGALKTWLKREVRAVQFNSSQDNFCLFYTRSKHHQIPTVLILFFNMVSAAFLGD